MSEVVNNETEFFFFLDAWNYCRIEKIPMEKIKRKNWKTWTVVK